MAPEHADPNEIRSSDIVFDCPYCQKSLAIDCRGAGLSISCPDCENKIQVPIPEGMEMYDLDSSDEDQEVRIIHMREVIAASQNSIIELEQTVKDLAIRRDDLERQRVDNALRCGVISREVELIQRSLARITEVLKGVDDQSKTATENSGKG